VATPPALDAAGLPSGGVEGCGVCDGDVFGLAAVSGPKRCGVLSNAVVAAMAATAATTMANKLPKRLRIMFSYSAAT
jgi:hypothetical protein